MNVDTSILAELWVLAKQAGPFATVLMSYLWWRSDQARDRLQTERNALLPLALKSANRQSRALLKLAHAIDKRLSVADLEFDEDADDQDD